MNHKTGENTTGSVSIKDHAIATIAGMSALHVSKVVSLKGSFWEDIIEIFWKKLPYKGVRVNLSDKDVSVALSVAVKYGADIADVASEIQEKVKGKVENMTGLNVVAVDVNIVSVS